jgi:tetratricopeptide (TPR) repeat protein
VRLKQKTNIDFGDAPPQSGAKAGSHSMKLSNFAVAAALALTVFAPGSYAQLVTRPTLDTSRMDDAIKIYQDAVALYQKGEFKVAEKKLEDFLGRTADHAGGNFMMGLVQLELQDLDRSRIFLRNAVKYDPQMVSAKGYLGAIEYILGEPAKGQEQRAALAAMKTACAGACPKAADIDQAIERIDANAAALAEEGS